MRWLRQLACHTDSLQRLASTSCHHYHAAVKPIAMSVQVDKKALRKSTSRLLKDADPTDLQQQSQRIAQSVLHSRFFQESTSTGLYLTCAKLREVDTSPLLEAILADGNRKCFAPAVEDKKSNMNFLHVDSMDGVEEMPPYGIREPTQTYADGRPRDNVLRMERPLDLLIMTGQAFDREGGRLGRGGGYYDKFIARCTNKAKQRDWQPPLLVALAFEQQLVSEGVPKSSNDADMDIVVLPSGPLACSERGRAAMDGSGS